MIANIVNIMFKLFGLTLFWPMFPFYIPWQTSESLCFPGVFRCLNKKVGQKWISHFESTFAYIGNNMYLFVFFRKTLKVCVSLSDIMPTQFIL